MVVSRLGFEARDFKGLTRLGVTCRVVLRLLKELNEPAPLTKMEVDLLHLRSMDDTWMLGVGAHGIIGTEGRGGHHPSAEYL